MAFNIYVLPNTLKLVFKSVAKCPCITKFFVSTDNNDIVLFISSNNLGCSLLLLYTLHIRKISNFGSSKLKVSDSAGAFHSSSNVIDITLYMQNAKQLDKFSWSKHIKPLQEKLAFFVNIEKNLCSFLQIFEYCEILQMLNSVAENNTLLSF